MHTSGVIQFTAYSPYIRLFLKVYLSRFVTSHFKLDYVAYEFSTKLALDLLQNNDILRWFYTSKKGQKRGHFCLMFHAARNERHVLNDLSTLSSSNWIEFLCMLLKKRE